MTMAPPREVIGARRFFRAIRLERDIADPAAIDAYLLTPQARQVLRYLEEGLRDGGTERAWTLTGPYGSGKSSFALFLAQLLADTCDQSSRSWTMLRDNDFDLAQQLSQTLRGRGLLPVSLTLRRAPLARSLIEGLCTATVALDPSNAATALLADLNADLASERLDSRAVLHRVEALRDLIVGQGAYCGLLLTLDELGKALEHTAHRPDEDIYLLQELAEVASRSQDQPLVVIGILHQAFEHYGERLDLSARKEWAKVQGRFRDISFLEPPEQQIRLASAAIAALDLDIAAGQRDRLAAIAREVVAEGHAPTGMRADEFVTLASSAYPLHPTVLAALPHLFRRLAQNERSLFTYLGSQEPFGLQERLRERPEDLVRLPDLFEYVAANLSGSLARQTATRRWLEVVDALDRAPELPPLEMDLLKSLGALGILGDTPTVQPTEALLSLALADSAQDSAVQGALADLQRRSLVVFRRFTRAYRIWEGSDVDVEERVAEGERKTAGQPGLAESLGRFLPQRPLVARRHAHETGALRAFAVRYLDEPVATDQLLPIANLDGVVACCLPATPDQVERFLAWAASPEVAALPHLLVAVPEQIGALREVTNELRALRWAWENTPELRDDRVARRELGERIANVEQGLTQLAATLLDPRPAPVGMQARWFVQGQPIPVRTAAEVSALLSRMMDALYPYAPRIWNELINRRALSSAAAAARRTLVERMLTHQHQPLLGMTGFPPERSMYASVLLATGLHREQDGRWDFAAPPPADPQRLGPVWTALEQAVFDAGGDTRAVSDLLALLAAPPYGVLPGVFPVLLATFLLVHRDETSLYREGSFVPDLGIADFEVLMRRPELFAVGGSRLIGERVAVVERLARGLGTRPLALPVVRELLRQVRALPDHAWRTRRLSEPTLALRTAIDRARSPERLLFHDMPVALGAFPFESDATPDPERIDAFFAQLNAALQEWQAALPTTIGTARDVLLTACDQPPGMAGWAALRQLARQLNADRLHPALAPFARRLTEAGEPERVLESVLALVATRPPRSWTDADRDHFSSQAAETGARFRQSILRLGVLTEEEEGRVQALTARVKALPAATASPRVFRAALARLLEELDEIEEASE